MPTRYPAASNTELIRAQVLPLPFVPATVNTGQEKEIPIRAIIVRIRVKPNSMGLSVRYSAYESQEVRESGVLLIESKAMITGPVGP